MTRIGWDYASSSLHNEDTLNQPAETNSGETEDRAFDDLVCLAALVGGAPMAGLACRHAHGWALRAGVGLENRDSRRCRWGHRRACISWRAEMPEIGFYAGMPVSPRSGPPGVLFIMDPTPRPAGLDAAGQEALRLLAGQAATLLEHATERQDARLYREIFQVAPLDLVLIDVGQDGAFRYDDLNRAHRHNSGFTAEGFIGRGPDDVFEPAIAAMARSLYTEVLQTRRSLEYERTLPFPSGERIRRSTMVPLTDATGRVAKILLGAIDLTEMRRMEAELRQAQKMEAMGQLTGGIAHDFNNLLAAIIGSLELLLPAIGNGPQRRRLGIALRAAERGARLTSQLLAFARKQHVTPRPVAVGAVLAAVNEMLPRLLGGLVQVEIAPAADLWPALAEPTQLEQAILNLAINARDAMPSGGRIVIAAANVSVVTEKETSPGDYVRISVIDEGCGMAPEVLEKAFEPFFTTKPVGKGSGLGLSQVYGLIRQLGGTVRIATAIGAGTTVELLLPRAAAAPAEVQGATVGFATGVANLLVVDDDADVLDVTACMLEGAGYQVRTACGGAEALEMLAEATPDLLLLDYAMPGMSGAELARRVRELWPELPMLFLTGYADALPAGELPGVGVLVKPCSQAELLAGVARALRVRDAASA